jgi:hypothetical protein
MCIGAVKSGTTTLYDILRQHPEVYIPSFKEPHFFDIPQNYENGIDWYRKNYFKRIKKETCIGDFTPSYLFETKAPERIYNTLGPNVKFIVLLRNPVDRAYSHYLHSIRDEHEHLDFKQAIQLERNRLAQYAKEDNYLAYLRHSYFHQGLYGNMVERYLQYFPLEQFLFINFEEEFLQQREDTITSILDFLGINNQVVLRIDLKSNPASKSRSKKLKKIMKKKGWWRVFLKWIIPSLKIRQIIKNKLQRLNITRFTPKSLNQAVKEKMYADYFAEDVSKLEQLIDRKMNWGCYTN